jgi:hypothetical protein
MLCPDSQVKFSGEELFRRVIFGFRLRDDSDEDKPTVTPRRIEYHYNY